MLGTLAGCWLPSLVFGRLLPQQKLADSCVNAVMMPEGHISRHKVVDFDGIWKAASVLAPNEILDAASIFWSQYNIVNASIHCGMCSATAPCKHGSQSDGSGLTGASVLFLPHTMCCAAPFTGSFCLTCGGANGTLKIFRDVYCQDAHANLHRQKHCVHMTLGMYCH